MEDMATLTRIVPCLWFNDQAEAAAQLYTSVFPNGRVIRVVPYGEAGYEHHKRAAGSVMVVDFELDGQPFTALNGGPIFTFNEAVSLQIMCDTQDEVDHYWNRLTDGGDPKAQQCGWLKDKFGVSWQVVPNVVNAMLTDPDSTKSQRAFAAMMPMKKLDIAALERAFNGVG
jgi:predicted 3-demethylubiquinone-9 3-methyltransferase (glyoxalase superfamily)